MSPKRLIIHWVNRAHPHPSPWVRRPAVVLGVFALTVNTIVFYAVLPVMVAVLLAFDVFRFVAKFIVSIPAGTAAIISEERCEWSRNIAGARRVWQSQKVEPEMERDQ